ncbi:MAG: hypothetical protein CMM02_03245 [Rhodopirellula sp.]|nr:hypothetical protein [Rhodopirellula sp.]|tara:strand:+ start:1416 stop:2600 length:1185 start_codon:yes stop_codon:yes gene_type:complete
MFKDKTSKKRINNDKYKDNCTLDTMHHNIIDKFKEKTKDYNNYVEYLSKLNIEKESIMSNIVELSKEKVNIQSDEYDNLWNSNIKIKEEIYKINKNIEEIRNNNEIEYYTNTSEILFNYYNMLEDESNRNNNNKNKKTVLDALNNKKENKINTDKTNLVDEYLSLTNKQYVKKVNKENIEICKECDNQLTCLQHEAIMICNKCGYQELLLVEQNRPILKQNTKDTSHFSYKRINHFREWCNQVQGKESTDIPDEIFESILNEIKKEKITDTTTITYTKMREILKRLRINKYYEHINYILNRINGIPTPQFSSELEDKLCLMFRDIQGPFLKHCPKDRKNFLSYSYVLYKFFQILGLNQYLKYFPLLKSREKLYLQDQIWKKICEELGYPIIPSL